MERMQRGWTTALLAAYAVVSVGGAALGVEAVWSQLATGAAQKWDLDANWTPNDYPNGVGDVAVVTQSLGSVNSLIVGLYETTTTVSRLVLGNTSGTTKVCEIRSSAAEKWLAFRGVGDAPAVFEVYPGIVALTDVMNAYVALHSSLVYTNNGVQNVTVSTGKILDIGSRALTLEGTGTASLNFNGDVIGTGAITNNSLGTIGLGVNVGAKSFAGDLTVNRGAMLAVDGSFRNGRDATFVGAINASSVEQGGTVTLGSGSAKPANPGQRLPARRMVFRGGWLTDSGQPASTGTWTDPVVDEVQEFHVAEGYSMIRFGYGSLSGGTWIKGNKLVRTPGAVLAIRGDYMAGLTRCSFTNAASYLLGGGGAEGSQTMSIFPWLMVANSNSYAANPASFGVHTSTGVRGLFGAEAATSLTAGSDRNVNANAAVLASDATVNALATTSANSGNLGTGRTLTIASGGLLFGLNGSWIGVPGASNAGIVNFGGAEGIVWSLGANTNVIGSVIAGSGGLTKAGVGTLTLAAQNTFTGPTTVASGVLIVGVSGYGSRVNGDVTVAQGARCVIIADSSAAIPDTAVVRLLRANHLFGKLDLGSGVTESVKNLYLGDDVQPVGTYGSTSSSAVYKDDRYFAGTGILTVTEMPGAISTTTVILLR